MRHRRYGSRHKAKDDADLQISAADPRQAVTTLHSLKRLPLNKTEAAGDVRFLHLMQGLTPEALWRRCFIVTIYYAASTAPPLPIENGGPPEQPVC